MKKNFALVIVIGVFLFIQPISAQTWENTKRFTWNIGDSENPALAIDSGNNIHVVWSDNSKNNNYEILHKKSSDGGTTWSPYKRLTWNSGVSENPAIAIDSSDNIHVVWEDNSPGNYEIYYKKSTTEGTTWAPTKRFTWSTQYSGKPAIALDSANVLYVVWYDFSLAYPSILFKKSTNGGTTWSNYNIVGSNEYSVANPDLAVDSGNNIHLVYNTITGRKGYTWGVIYIRSTDGGSSWHLGRLLDERPADSIFPKIAIDTSDSPHVVWETGNEIEYDKSTDGGLTWSGNMAITHLVGASKHPKIAIDLSNNIHIVWYDNNRWVIKNKDENYQILHIKSTDVGSTWSVLERLTWKSGDSIYPSIALDLSNDIFVFWSNDSAGNLEIYRKKGIQ